MNPDEIIALQRDVLRLFSHVMDNQREIAALKARVSELEHDSELEQITGGQGAFSR